MRGFVKTQRSFVQECDEFANQAMSRRIRNPNSVDTAYVWRNNRLNFMVVGIGDIGFILTILMPAYVPLVPGG